VRRRVCNCILHAVFVRISRPRSTRVGGSPPPRFLAWHVVRPTGALRCGGAQWSLSAAPRPRQRPSICSRGTSYGKRRATSRERMRTSFRASQLRRIHLPRHACRRWQGVAGSRVEEVKSSTCELKQVRRSESSRTCSRSRKFSCATSSSTLSALAWPSNHGCYASVKDISSLNMDHAIDCWLGTMSLARL
jgi:hypothetical protein